MKNTSRWREGVTPVLAGAAPCPWPAPLTGCGPPPSELSRRLCDEFRGAGGQGSEVKGTPAGNRGCSGLQ